MENNHPNETVELIKSYLENRGVNITDYLMETILKNYENLQTSNNNVEYIDRVENNNNILGNLQCGGKIKMFAKIYASDYHPYCAVLICLFGIITNCLNVVIFTRKEMATAPINRILTALAWAEICLMIEYIPFVIYDKLDQLQKVLSYYGAVFMLFHAHFTQIVHTVSICLTLTLAIWRFLAIKYLEKNYKFCSHKRCTLAIFLCIILPIILCIPQYITFKISGKSISESSRNITLYKVDLRKNNYENKFLNNNMTFGFYSIFLKLLPCLILIIISIWLVRALLKAKKGRQVLKTGYEINLLNPSSDALSHCKNTKIRKQSKYERRADRTTKMLIAILLLFLITELPQGLFSLIIAITDDQLFETCYQYYGEIMDISALFNGSINFILYCFMNRMFRKTLGQMIEKWTRSNVSKTPKVVIVNKMITTTTTTL